MSDKMITIEYNGKKVLKKELCLGVVESGQAYLIKCSVSGEWCYCNQERFDKLVAKFGSQEAVGLKYVSRDGKREQTGKAPIEKKEYKVRQIEPGADSANDGVPRDERRFIAPEVAPPDYDPNKEGFVKTKGADEAETD